VLHAIERGFGMSLFFLSAFIYNPTHRSFPLNPKGKVNRMGHLFKKEDIPNMITFFRGAAAVAVAVVILLMTSWTGRWTLSFWLFFLACLSDFFDGYLARRLKAQSKLGAFLDPLFDKALVLPLLVIFVPLKIIPAFVLILLFARDVAVSLLRSYLAKRGVSLPADILAKWKAVWQMTMLGFILGHMCWPAAWGFREAAFISGWVALFFSLVSAWGYFYRFFTVSSVKK